MGTETYYLHNTVSKNTGFYVKLNNPQMGTETLESP